MRFVVWRLSDTAARGQIAPADPLESWRANGLWRHRRSLGDGVRNRLHGLCWLRAGSDDDQQLIGHAAEIAPHLLWVAVVGMVALLGAEQVVFRARLRAVERPVAALVESPA